MEIIPVGTVFISVLAFHYFRKKNVDTKLFWGPKFFIKSMGQTSSTFEKIIPDSEVNANKLMTYEKIFSLTPCSYSLSRYI